MTAFIKYHGLGNDFVILDQRERGNLIRPQTAVSLCDRHRGIGADGILTLLPPRFADAQLRMHLYNADGSVAEMCGNGLRCVIDYVAPSLATHGPIRVDTDAGPREGWLESSSVRVSLGRPTLGEALSFEVHGEPVEGLNVSMGNPHFVLRPADSDVDLYRVAAELGPRIQARSEFPESTNVEWMRWDGHILELVVFERGAGLTQACGTGAGAAVVAAQHWGLVPPATRTTVRLPGGELGVEAERDAAGQPSMVFIIGEAVEVFRGDVDLPGA